VSMRLFSLVALAGLSSACVSVLPEPPAPPRIYTLTAADPTAWSHPPHRGDVVVAVGLPAGPRALMGAEIAWRTDGVVAFVAGAEWAGRAPELLQTLLAETVDQSGFVQAGVRAGAGVQADYEIIWDLTAFHVDEEGGALTAHFGAVARLVDAGTRVLVAQSRVEEAVPVADRSQGAATRALEQATRDAAGRIARELGMAAASARPAN
jgi:cholesterol transport system auxiliary component